MEGADCFESLQIELVLANIQAHDIVRFVYHGGKFILDTGELIVPAALWDSGALHASYMSQDYLDKHMDVLEPYLESCRSHVRMAAGDQRLEITQHVVLPIVFCDDAGAEYRATIQFYILPQSHNDVVIGLPAIVLHFGKIYVQRIQTAIDQHGVDSVVQHIVAHDDDLIPPFSKPPDAEAPEDAETPLPCSFPDVLHFMEMSPAEARAEYFSQFDEHISLAFRSSTPVEQLLKTKGVQVFVPTNWDGIKHVAPLELNWKDDLPERLKPRARPVNPRLYEAAKKEFDRLLGYFYKPSDSPVASCLVIAPKATKPFIRFCGDYVQINKHILTGHYPIPHVQRSLEKIREFAVFIDLDLVNSFHQFRLAPLTSRNLSVQTPWGQVEPLFLPEGVAPASFVLQEAVTKIFGIFDEWTITLFDNILLLAHDYHDAYQKLERLLDRCIEYNLYLKFSKTWLGFDKVHFFGYDCVHNSYSISPDRKKALSEYSPPQSQKQMQSFLGAALYFKSFVPHYSSLAAPLHEMTKKDQKWDATIWTPARLAAFTDFKQALLNSFAIYYPDYSLTWILRTDASLDGVGMGLFQLYYPTPESEPEYQVIMFASQKFSPQARNWSTIEQEAYGIYFGVKTCSYYLRCKEFILETDHANLQWIEASEVPKIIRWRIFLQSFSFLLRHLKGKLNKLADWQSRLYSEEATAAMLVEDPLVLSYLSISMHAEEGDPQLSLPDFDGTGPEACDIVLHNAQQLPPPATAKEYFLRVHGGRNGHFGAKRTWKALNKYFPGHRIPFKVIEDLVSSCAVCQKDRLGMDGTLTPVYRTLKTGEKRRRVGVDTLTITPADKHGMCYCTVVVVEASKLVAIYPSVDKTALDTALALFRFFATYGVYDELISDPGSDLTSEVIAHLTQWFGIRHVFSLVDRHESNGVEGSNKQILRHIKALVADERVADRWSEPHIICFVAHILNSEVNSETNMVPFHLHFGTDDYTYLKLPEATSATATAHAFVKLLDKDLRTLWEASKRHQSKIVAIRSKHDAPGKQNQFQPGDLVLFQLDPSKMLPSKLTMKYRGPYEVIEQYKNDVQCRHLCMKTVATIPVDRLKLFSGTRSDGEKVAQLDYDQHDIAEILYWRGNPMQRTNMEFYIRFADGEAKWITWNSDLFNCQPYEDFCHRHPPLFPLIYTKAVADRKIRELNAQPITEVTPTTEFYLDLRYFGGSTWYNSIGLPDSEKLTYVMHCTYQRWVGVNQLKIEFSCTITREVFIEKHYFVYAYGSALTFDATFMVLIDSALCQQYPLILPQPPAPARVHRPV